MTVENLTKIISTISKTNPTVVTTSAVHGYSSGDFVRISNIGNAGNVDFGMDQLADRKFKITVTSTTAFTLRDPITNAKIDSTGFQTYTSGGFVNKIRTSYTFT